MRRERPDGLERLVDAVVALRRRVGLVYVASAITAAAAVVLLLSVIPADLREGRGSPLPLLLALLLLLAIAVGTVLYGRIRGELTPPALAPEADQAAGLGEGDVLAALELPPLETHAGRDAVPSLAGLHRSRVAEGLAGVARDRLLPVSASRWRRRAMWALYLGAAALSILAVSVVARPGATFSAATALGAPWRTAFPAPLLPLQVHLQEEEVARGRPVLVQVLAPGRYEVELVWQVTGEPPRRRVLAVGEGDEASGSTDPISAQLSVWVEDAEGETSDTLIVRPVEPLLVEDLRATIRYPAYLGRGGEVHRGRIPPLVIPEGTHIALAGEANHTLEAASLALTPMEPTPGTGLPERVISLDLTGRGFSGELEPERSGRWTWHLESTLGIGAPIVPGPLELIVIPDGRPDIRLLFPAPDTLLGPDAVMPLVLDIEDDLGLLRAELAWWRSVPGGGPPDQRRTALSPDPDGQKRAIFRPILDLRGEDLLPGDTVFYRILAYDGHPRRGPSQSETFLLRVPTLTELRAARANESEAIAEDTRELVEAAQDLERAAADAERRSLSEGQADAAQPGELGFEETEEARGILEQAEGMQEGIHELEEDLQALQDDIRESVLADAALEEQLAQLAERYQELLEAGLAERIEELSRALRDLDSEAVREALESMAGEADWLRDQIEQTLSLLEQAALDQAVEAARAETGELADAQRNAVEDTGAAPDEWAAEEERLAEEADELAESLDELARRLEEAGQEAASDSAGTAGARADRAADAMREAATAAAGNAPDPGGDPEAERARDSARQSAEEAAQALEQAASALDDATDQMSGREDAAESLGRARAEALSLANAESDLAEAARGTESIGPETWRARQAAVRQGLENLVSTLSEDGSRSWVLDREIGTAADEAAGQMDQLLERMTSDGGRRLPSRSEAEGVVEALNELAARLIASEQAAQAAQEQAGQEAAAEQMTSLAQQQQGVTQRTSTLLVPGPKPSGEERTSEVARQQQEIAQQLRELDDPQNELLGRPEELAREAAEIAQRIEAEGASTQTFERQRRLFRRMLDAGRSLEDEDLDPNRRESETGRAAPRPPPQIDPSLLRGVRFPLPSEALLRDLPLFYRRLIFDYFDRLNRGPGGPPRPTNPDSRDDGERR